MISSQTKKGFGVGLGIAAALGLLLLFWIMPLLRPATEPMAPVDYVTIVDGRQIIDITARGGYTPKYVEAQAGLPTVIRVATKNTYDCSAALVIRDLDFDQMLKPNEVTEIEVPAERAKGIIQGSCSMGMYGFRIRFL